MHPDRTTAAVLLAAATLGGCASSGTADEPAAEPATLDAPADEAAAPVTPSLPAEELTNPGPTALFSPVTGWDGTGVDLRADGFVAVFNTANPADIQVLNLESPGSVRWTPGETDDQVTLVISGPGGSDLSFPFAISGDRMEPVGLEGVTEGDLTLRQRP